MKKTKSPDLPSSVDRRGLLKWSAGVGIAVAAQSLLAQQSPQSPQQTLTIAVPSVKPGLDPATVSTLDGYMLTQAIFSNLTWVDEKLVLRPQLASSWKANKIGTTWTFELVKGVRFHNGRELTADDVKFSLDRILDPKTASQGGKLLGPISAVKVQGPYTILIELSRPSGDIPILLSGPHGRIVAKENIPQIASAPIGTGPFKLVEYVQGQRAVLQRNPNYFEPGLPKIAEIRQVYIKEIAAQMTALERGEIDVMMTVSQELALLLKRKRTLSVLEVPASGFHTITMFADKKPTNDAKVREALRLAANRPIMLELAANGYGSIGNDTPVSPISPYFNKGLKQRLYDPTRARALLVEAGFKDGLDITLYTSNGRPGLEEAAVAYRQSAALAGIRVKIESVEIARLFSEFARQPRENTIVHVSWGGRAYGDPMGLFVGSESSWNYGRYSNSVVDGLLAKAEAELDPVKKKQFYGRAQEIFWTDGTEIVPYFLNHIAATRKNVKNYLMHPSQFVDLRYVYIE